MDLFTISTIYDIHLSRDVYISNVRIRMDFMWDNLWFHQLKYLHISVPNIQVLAHLREKYNWIVNFKRFMSKHWNGLRICFVFVCRLQHIIECNSVQLSLLMTQTFQSNTPWCCTKTKWVITYCTLSDSVYCEFLLQTFNRQTVLDDSTKIPLLNLFWVWNK